MPDWNIEEPADTDAIKLGAGVIRKDKETILTVLEKEHDFPTSGKHKDVSIISGSLTLHDGICNVKTLIDEDAAVFSSPTFSPALASANYAIFHETSWKTPTSITAKTTTGFSLSFGTAVPADSGTVAEEDATHTVSWMIVFGGAT